MLGVVTGAFPCLTLLEETGIINQLPLESSFPDLSPENGLKESALQQG